MVKRPTVLILGAGASVDYDFPTGPELVQRIIPGLRDGGRLAPAILASDTGNSSQVTAFREDLIDSQRSSIDRFLRTRSES